MSNNVTNQSTNDLSKYEDFIIEFYGYNFTASGVVKKMYIKPPFANKECTDREILLDSDKLKLIDISLNNKYLSSFISERYSLYDISFRESDIAGSIGFSFNDIRDSTYIEPKLIFKPFEDLGIDYFCEIINKIQNNMFLQQPQYNPIFMLGLVLDDANLTCIKSYIRFDLEEFPTLIERGCMVERIAKAVNPPQASVKLFSNFIQKLENIGFVFSFIGVDNYDDGLVRFKLYFRLYKENDLGSVPKEIILILSQFGLYNDAQDIFDKYLNGVWGLAISTATFEYVNGVQVYFYP